jgi:hypothetical protein
VAEAAVVGKPHEIKGESVFAYVVLKGDRPTGDKAEAFAKELRAHVTEQLGAIARPDDIRFADNLPKTRSGKIMRRLLRAVARNEDITQDLSTLENPAIIEQLRGNESAVSASAPAKTAAVKGAAAAKAVRTVPAPARAASGKSAAKATARKPAKKPVAKKTPLRKTAARKKLADKARGFLGKLTKKAAKVVKKSAGLAKRAAKKVGRISTKKSTKKSAIRPVKKKAPARRQPARRKK